MSSVPDGAVTGKVMADRLAALLAVLFRGEAWRHFSAEPARDCTCAPDCGGQGRGTRPKGLALTGAGTSARLSQ